MAKVLIAHEREFREFDVEFLGNTLDLAMAIVHHHKVDFIDPPLMVFRTKEAGKYERILFRPNITEDVSISEKYARSHFEMQGRTMIRETGDSTYHYSNDAILFLNMISKRGKIKIFTHTWEEQPKSPLVQLEWWEMIARVNNMKDPVLETKITAHGQVMRGVVQEAEFMNDRFTITCDSLRHRLPNCWGITDNKVFNSLIPQELDKPKPLAHANDRITFEVGKYSCTIYPKDMIKWD
jgi:hypothetical protein